MPSTELWESSPYSALFLLHLHVCAHMCGGQSSASSIMPAQALSTLFYEATPLTDVVFVIYTRDYQTAELFMRETNT